MGIKTDVGPHKLTNGEDAVPDEDLTVNFRNIYTYTGGSFKFQPFSLVLASIYIRRWNDVKKTTQMTMTVPGIGGYSATQIFGKLMS